MPNKKTAAQRQPYVDAMKGFGILCVVIGHFIEYHRGTAPGINALFTCIYLFHMAIFCTASGLVAKFSLRKLVTQQLWLYLISQAGITAFRAAALKDNIVVSVRPHVLDAHRAFAARHPAARPAGQHRRDGRGHCHRPVGRLCQLAV